LSSSSSSSSAPPPPPPPQSLTLPKVKGVPAMTSLESKEFLVVQAKVAVSTGKVANSNNAAESTEVYTILGSSWDDPRTILG
jgi:hypothetical protein